MLDLEVIDKPGTAVAALEPVRSRILAALTEQGSATSVALRLGISRQNVNHHLRILEAHGLVEFVEERQRRGLKERIMIASARSYVVSPAALGITGADPSGTDRLSTRYLIAIAARMVREVAELARNAERAKQPLATLTIDTKIRFASAAERAKFTDELTSAVAGLAAKYHDEATSGGRWHRLVVASHPCPPPVEPGVKETNDVR